MALSKKIENLVVGVDTKNCLVKILRNNGNDFKKATIEELSCENELIENQKIYDILVKILGYYLVSQRPVNPDVYVVLPDYFVTKDVITLPLLPQVKQKEVLRAELKRLYPNFDNLAISTTVLAKNKKQIVFSVVLVQKGLLLDCVLACKKHGLNLKGITYSSNCIINSFLALAKGKYANFLYVNVEETTSKIIYAMQGKTVCALPLGFGKDFLSIEQQNFLPNFVSSLVAQKELFNSAENLGAVSYSQSPEIDQFEKFCQTQTNKRLKAEEVLQSDKKTVLQNNFQVFSRYILGAAESIAQKTGLLLPDVAIVNLPANLASAIKNTDLDIKIALAKDELAEPCLLLDYFDLYGAIFCEKFNRSQNFLDRQNSVFKRK